MSDYMYSNNSVEPTDEFDRSSLSLQRIHRVENITDNERARKLVENVEKIHQAAQSDPIPADKQVVGAMSPLWGPQSYEECYYFQCAPIAAQIEGLDWNTAYRIDLDDAVSVESAEYKEVASEFGIPESSLRDSVPNFITQAYRHLKRLTEQNDGQRAVHPWELSHTSKTPFLAEQNYDYAFEFLDKLPGVISPDRNGNAWEYQTETEGTETEKSHV